jgi:hypothetical protein
MAKRRSQKEHDDLVSMMARYFKDQGYTNIQADIDGYQAPPIIKGKVKSHRPDLLCNKTSTTQIILEAETDDTIDDEHTRSQWHLFWDWAKNHGNEFHLVVPEGYRDAANRRLNEIGISADTIWTPS